ncbi:hypothetical protein FZEAL_320 [Fusarium zealandicum]|uniref:Indole-diterpene biosynthesis protein n=1 Tax=Fusarium zealandicum TaxID=1053134 RepID=A0A8H4XQI6_9HYPO|nr:hypothetical protein FZEAL_320 [Fusarium zealandicum]
MASTNTAVGKPLSFMDNLSSQVLLYRPASSTDTAASPDISPKLVILATWTNALDSHIAKYVNKYKALYPSAQILLVKSTSKIMFNPQHLDETVQPIVPVIRANLPADQSPSSSGPALLIHMLSNGGSSSVSAICKAYAALARDGEDPNLPPHVKIFDSSPGISTLRGTVSFFQVGLPTLQRLLVTPLLYLASFLWGVGNMLGLTRDWLAFWGRTHNEARAHEARRTYIYSETDALVTYQAVEAHATEAEKLGFQVRREKFDGSPHVAHARKYETEYWAVVKSTWEGNYA